MPRPGFYNDNEYRAYPFVYKTDYFGEALPDSAVVDCGIIMGLSSGFSHSEHAVWLASITRSGGVIQFEFATDAPGAAELPLVFECSENASEWEAVFSQSAPASGFDLECATEPAWEGFLVPGPLTELLELLSANGDTLSFPSGERDLEPGRIQSLVKSYVRSISLGNLPRVRALPPSDCAESSDSLSSEDIVVNAVCMQGDLRIKEGYNCRIKQTDRLNELRVIAEKGAGDTARSELCDHGSELPLYSSEPFDEETGFYSGGPSCSQTISTINGIGGANVNIVGGTGVTVNANAETNTVTVALAQNNFVGNCGT